MRCIRLSIFFDGWHTWSFFSSLLCASVRACFFFLFAKTLKELLVILWLHLSLSLVGFIFSFSFCPRCQNIARRRLKSNRARINGSRAHVASFLPHPQHRMHPARDAYGRRKPPGCPRCTTSFSSLSGVAVFPFFYFCACYFAAAGSCATTTRARIVGV